MLDQLERAVARHCAPVLIGDKPAGLICLPASIQEAMGALSESLRSGYSVYTLLLRKGPKRCLYMLFAPDRLSRFLAEEPVAQALRALGYSCGRGLAGPLSRLRRRCGRKDFPHEIGFFLGYPWQDVVGFMRHRGRHYKWAGPWKVYGDVETARSLCASYAHCCQALGRHLEGGGSLEDFPCKREARSGASTLTSQRSSQSNQENPAHISPA